MDFLKQKFVVCGRVFVPFHAKESNVYMIETNENVDRISKAAYGDQHRLSFKQFVNEYNPLELNYGQVGDNSFGHTQH